MANLPEVTQYDAGVYQLETTDPVVGGADGVSNTPLKNLTNRTNYLKKHVDDLESGATIPPTVAPKNSPALTGDPTAPTAASGDNDTSLATTAFVQRRHRGRLSKDIAGGVNASLTADEAGYGILAFTGTITANIAVIVPTATGRWVIENKTVGAFTLTIKTAAGTGPTVEQGKSREVYCDGTNVYAIERDHKDLAMTGAPTAPTAAPGTTNTQVANAAFLNQTLYGMTTKDVAGGSTVTLTAAEAANGMLVFTGALTAPIAVEVPAARKHWIVSNNTTGDFSLTLRCAGQTGVPIPKGEPVFAYCNGTDVDLAGSGGSGGVTNVIVEEKTLIAGQTVVDFATVTTTGLAVYIEGAREFGYTVNSGSQISLGSSYPEGSKLWGVQNDPNGATQEVHEAKVGVSQVGTMRLGSYARVRFGYYYEESGRGGGEYAIKTLDDHRTDIGNPTWEPDGYVDHYDLDGNVLVLLHNGEIWDSQAGVKRGDVTFDSLAAWNALNSYVKSTATSKKVTVCMGPGPAYGSDTFVLAREVSYIGSGAKVTTFLPHSTWDNTSLKWIVKDELLDGAQGTPDNNFYNVRRDFGVRNDASVTNTGSLWARPGGGSEYTNLFLADAYGGETLRVTSDPEIGGAAVAATFNNIWLANTGANPGTGESGSRARNGLWVKSAYSVTFNNLIVDYQSNSTDYTDPTNDTDGFGVKIDNSVVVFNNINMEGNAKPFYVTSAQYCIINGGAVYRKGLGNITPSTDLDFIFRCSSQESMPNIHNLFASLGYAGGIATTIGSTTPYLIKTRGDIASVGGGGFSYFNDNNLNVRKLSIVGSLDVSPEIELGNAGVFYSPVSRTFRFISRLQHRSVVAAGAGGTVDIPLNGHGQIMLTALRSDSSNSNRGQVFSLLYNAESETGSVSITAQNDDSDSSLNPVTGFSVVSDGAGGSALRVSYGANANPFRLGVFFLGETSTSVDKT